MTLPRYSFIHRDYLELYMTELPKPILQTVAENFNCEDIAMSFFVSSMTNGRPPLLADYWAIKTMVKLHCPTTISGTSDHKKLRDECVESFATQLNLKGRLKKAKVVHGKDRFECGDKGNVESDGTPISERHASFIQRLKTWKKMHGGDFQKLLLAKMELISREAYVLGLVPKTSPWEKRWGKSRINEEDN
jgi:glucuronyl/N-acetylglucosaminyl transferase EXT2